MENTTDLVTIKELLDRAMAAHMREHELEHRAHERELQLSDTKFAKANEVREQIDRERGNFATREMHESLYASLSARLALIEKYQANLDGKLIGAGAVISLISLGISILSHFWK